MSISIFWEPATSSKAVAVNGTSTDWRIFNEVFREPELTHDAIPILLAMHAASQFDKSLWSDLVDALERVPAIRVFAEF